MEQDLEADTSVICLSQGDTFRHNLYPGYKAGRSRKPVGTAEVKRWLVAEHGAKLKPGIEADDILGILATNPRLIKGEKIIVSADKDLLTIPGLHYYGGEVITVTPDEAEINWLAQTLSGDTTDGYPGCPGVGATTARDVLTRNVALEAYEHVMLRGPRKGETVGNWREIEAPSRWDIVVSHYAKAGLTEEDAILQARLARILHNDDFNHKTQEVRLWTPL